MRERPKARSVARVGRSETRGQPCHLGDVTGISLKFIIGPAESRTRWLNAGCEATGSLVDLHPRFE
jgi:hypothetical protein